MKIKDLLEYQLNQRQKQWPVDSKATIIVDIDPEVFLRLTTTERSLDYVKDKSLTKQEYQKFIDDDNIRVHPFLIMDAGSGQIISHEGRSRAYAAMVNGDKFIRVAIILDPRSRQKSLKDVPQIWKGEFDEYYYVNYNDLISHNKLTIIDDNVQRQYQQTNENDNDHTETLKNTGFWGEQGAGCIVFSAKTKRFLIAHRSSEVQEPNSWGTWGGAIDKDEDPKTAIIRELEEETGMTVPILEIIPIFVFQKNNFKYFNYIVVIADEFTPALNWENQGYKWVTFDELIDVINPKHFGLVSILNDTSSVETMKKLSGVDELNEYSSTIKQDIQSYKKDLEKSNTDVRKGDNFHPSDVSLSGLTINEYFAKYGFSPIGSGQNAMVYSKDGYPYVIKVFTRDAAYIRWFKFCLDNQSNPYIPKIKGKMKKLHNHVFYVRLEKLDYVPKNKKVSVLIRKINNSIDWNLYKEDFGEDLYDIMVFLKQNRNLLDLHDENVLLRGNQPVIIDPLSNYKIHGSFIIHPLEEQVTLVENNRQDVYHATRFHNAIEILNKNVFQANTTHIIDDKEISGVSVTRDLNYALNYFKSSTDGIIFKLSLSKIKNNNKVLPIDFFMTTATHKDAGARANSLYVPDVMNTPHLRRTGLYNESEEFVIGDIKNASDVVEEILIPKRTAIAFKENYKKYPNSFNAERWRELKRLAAHPKSRFV